MIYCGQPVDVLALIGERMDDGREAKRRTTMTKALKSVEGMQGLCGSLESHRSALSCADADAESLSLPLSLGP